MSVESLADTINAIRTQMEAAENPIIRKTLKAALEEHHETAEELKRAFLDNLIEMVQMLGGNSADDPAFPWAKDAQEAIGAKLSVLKLT